MSASATRAPGSLTGWVALAVLLFALVAHLGAGVAEGGRIGRHPGGHGAVLVLFLWALAGWLGGLALATSRGRSVPAWMAAMGGAAGVIFTLLAI
jgi:hypothetical protein